MSYQIILESDKDDPDYFNFYLNEKLLISNIYLLIQPGDIDRIENIKNNTIGYSGRPYVNVRIMNLLIGKNMFYDENLQCYKLPIYLNPSHQFFLNLSKEYYFTDNISDLDIKLCLVVKGYENNKWFELSSFYRNFHKNKIGIYFGLSHNLLFLITDHCNPNLLYFCISIKYLWKDIDKANLVTHFENIIKEIETHLEEKNTFLVKCNIGELIATQYRYSKIYKIRCDELDSFQKLINDFEIQE